MKYIRILLFCIWALAMSCATQTTPMGGPKDTIPPNVLNYHPEENARNFNGKQITVEFNEAVVLNNPKEEILIIPSIGKQSEFKLRGNMLVITPETALRDSTTYNINFREGIKDLTEGNPAKTKNGDDLHLAFSTGPMLDTLSISGIVKNGLDEKIPENITIALYSTDTFDIFEDIPEYFTKSNKEGKFSITNLKAGKYRIYAFEDKNKNLKPETRSEKFGFLADTIRLDSPISKLEIPVVHIDTRPPRLLNRRAQSNANIIRFNKSMTEYHFVSEHKLISSFANNQTEILAYYPELDIDSLQVGIKAIDSTMQILDTLIYLKRDKNERIKDKFSVSTSTASYNIETNMLSFSIGYNKPLKAINHDSAFVRYDTITTFPLKFRSMKIDSMKNRITVNEMIPFDSLPKSPGITLARAYLVSIENDTTQQIGMEMKLFDSPSTAILILNIQTSEPHFVIQLVNSTGTVVASAIDQKKLTFKYLKPENLKIRAIIDKNANGVWDTAIYPQNREAERVIYYLNAEKKTDVPLRANWEVGPLNFRF